MRSTETKSSARTPLALALNLPDCDRPFTGHSLSAMSDVLRHFAAARAPYMREVDSPENPQLVKNRSASSCCQQTPFSLLQVHKMERPA